MYKKWGRDVFIMEASIVEGKKMMVVAAPREMGMGEEGLLPVVPFFLFGLYLKLYPCMGPVGCGWDKRWRCRPARGGELLSNPGDASRQRCEERDTHDTHSVIYSFIEYLAVIEGCWVQEHLWFSFLLSRTTGP